MGLAISRPVLVACLLATVWPRPAIAQDPPQPTIDASEPAAEYKHDKVVHAHRITGMPPRIDGLPNDEAWGQAQTVEGLIQWDPDNGEPMTERTRLQLAYDDRFIYIVIRCDDRTPDRIVGGLGRRDEPPPSDRIGIGIDPRHDHQTGYVFETNPSGVQSDFSFYNDTSADRDYESVWEVRTALTDGGWVAEYRVPFSQMRFVAAPGPGQVWGFTFRRTIQRLNETGDWTARPRGEQGIVSRWGHLVFDEALDPPRRIEWMPYVRGGAASVLSRGTDFSGGVGVDLRVGIGSGATLSATVNPDFGQVEQDPAVLNLTVFETFFPEKRSFFLEDSRTFVPPYGLFQLFHSRRIGRRPARYALESGDVEVDRPDATTILGAVKVTGKQSGWTYGALTAMTSAEEVEVLTADGVPTDRPAEPTTSYNVARIQRDVRQGTSNVGLIATGVMRKSDFDAFAAGGDFNLRWDRNRVNWNGHWAATRAPISGVMQSGFGGVSNFNFDRKHGGFYTHFDHFNPNFRVDDIGFFRGRANRTNIEGGVSAEQPDPWKMFRRLGGNMFAVNGRNDQGDPLARLVGWNFFTQFRTYWGLEGGGNHEFRAIDDLDTRGGPPIATPSNWHQYFFVSSDSRKTWRFNFGSDISNDEVGGWSVRFGPGLNLKPSGRLQMSVSANYTTGVDDAQWVQNVDANGDGVVDYVYGRLDRDVIDLTVRSTFAVHRDMTVQVFLQPFVAVGDYTDFRRLAAPRSYEFEPVNLDENPDFNTKSLRGNVVLRWEYVRGSTLYVAWNLATLDPTRPGVFQPWRDLKDTFGADGTRAFMVKLTYWLSR
jgi:Domain of unknown function (DUF5916)/Carbohydrate family 9 binding domain-like